MKIKNGIKEGFTTLTQDPSKKDWLANRDDARKYYTYDSSCIRCHQNTVSLDKLNVSTNLSAANMHKKYLEFKDTSNEMKCTQCHKYVGHKDLGKLLFEQKSKVPTTWEEWEKQREESLKNNKQAQNSN